MYKLQNLIGWRTATVVVWAAVVVSGWYWTQASIAASVPVRSDAVPPLAMDDMSNPVVLARLLGGTPPAEAGLGPGPADRFVLSGVIASAVGQGAALISVDGKPARAFAIGSELAPGYVLVAVATREAMLAEERNAQVRVVLSLPLQRSADALPAPLGAASGASNLTTPPAVTPSTGVSGASVTPSVAPSASEQVSPVPSRADSRRQPQTSLRREDRQTP